MDLVAAGMVSSVGRDLRTSCAAARAGISRPGQVPCRIKGSDDGPELAIGHCVAGLTNGFAGDARLIRLLSQALNDLFSHPGLPARSQNIGWYLGIPSNDRRRLGLDRIPNPEDRRAYEEGLPDPAAKVDHAARGRRILTDALEMAGGGRTVPGLRGVSTEGHVAFASLVNSAKRDLAAGEIEVAMVGCVDSLVTEPDLRWLSVTRRLKAGDHPVGMAAGEAAAIVVLVPRAPGTALARLRDVRQARTRLDSLSAEPPDGAGMTEVLLPLITMPDRRNLDWIVTDQNGEPHRAAEWAHAFIKLRGQVPGYAFPRVWYPVSSFGDTGTASGAVNTCVVLHAFQRHFSPDDVAVVVSRNDGFDSSAVVIGNGQA